MLLALANLNAIQLIFTTDILQRASRVGSSKLKVTFVKPLPVDIPTQISKSVGIRQTTDMGLTR